MEPVANRPLVIRIILAYLALQSLQLGVWALFAPRSFYDGFPGFGRTWVAIDGPYNEHLVRDVGALNLALLIVLAAAAITLSRQLIVVASLAAMTWGVPHLVYHLFNTDGLSSSDVIASIGGLFVFAVLPIVAIIASGGSTTPTASASER